MISPIIAVFSGGTSLEREVSLGSGAACAKALGENFKTEIFDVREEAIPAGVDPARHVVFSTLHGTFGEDGGMQRLLDTAGIHYAGCDAASSALTMDKTATKRAVSTRGVQVIKGLTFTAKQKPTMEEIVAQLGERVVVKPNDEGSSIGLKMPENRRELAVVLSDITRGTWLAESRIVGRELAVGVLDGKAMGVVEIRPKSGVYDYTSKYTKGMTDYFAPAPMSDAATARVRGLAETAYSACGCRDYGRVDFIFSEPNDFFLLEINTLPGMKETSLLPMSARCVGLDFTALVREMVSPALKRFRAAQASLPT